MNKHLTSTKTAAVAASAVALAAGGVALAHPSPNPDAANPATSFQLRQIVLRANELPSFVPLTCPLGQTNAARWAEANGAAVDDVRRNGFLVGIREPLQSTTLAAQGVSVAAMFRSAAGARNQVDQDVASARARSGFSSFAVADIPGAHGFVLARGGSTAYEIAFARGAYEYVVGVGFSASSRRAPSRVELVAAARVVYRRAAAIAR